MFGAKHSSYTCNRYRHLLLLGSILGTGLGTSALAQDIGQPPIRLPTDENGIDLSTGQPTAQGGSVSIGDPGNGGMSVDVQWINGTWVHPYDISLGLGSAANVDLAVISLGDRLVRFSSYNGSPFSPEAGDGATLDRAADNSYTYTARDGTSIFFPSGSTRPAALTRPNGERVAFSFAVTTGYLVGAGPVTISRLQSATSNSGYQAKFGYAADSIATNNTSQTAQWMQLTSVQMINNAVDFCAPSANQCSGLSQSWPTLTLANTTSPGIKTRTITDSLGQTTTLTFDSSSRLTGVKLPASTSDDIIYSYNSDSLVASIWKAGRTTNYTWSLNDVLTTVASDGEGTLRTTTADTVNHVVLTDADGLGRTTTYTYDSFGRQTVATFPENNKVQTTYDNRGNITELRQIAKPGSGLTDLVVAASFDATCSNPKTCNRPNWTRDAQANQIDYTYDPTHGGMLTLTSPAPSTGAARPQIRSSYSPMQAYYKTSSGASPVASGQPVYKLTGTSTCITSTTCTGAAEEKKTTIDYGIFTSGTPNNLLPVSETSAAGDNSVSATSRMTYDSVGNLLSVDGPLSGSADTTAYKYDVIRRRVGVISPMPNGASVYPAQRTTFDSHGYKALEQIGTVTNQSDTAWSNFALAYQRAWFNNPLGLPTRTTVWSNNVDYAVRDFVYDTRGRLSCTIDYMNPANWGPQATSCTVLQTNGPNGPDRIVQNIYDAANQVIQIKRGLYGTVVLTNEFTGYTNNGKAQYVIDGAGNRTTYAYDGFDRLVQTNFPNTAQGTSGSSSSTDYERLTYGDNVHITSVRLRDGSSTSQTYDNLGRLSSKTPSGEATVSYAYTQQGRPTHVWRPADGTHVYRAYDALDRLTQETQPFGAVSYQYSLPIGGPTKLTWSDGFYIAYDYDSAGDVIKIRENGATTGIGVLATYTYDNLGRRSNVAYGNGTTRTYEYDAISRLKGINVDLAGTANDLIIGSVGGSGTAISYNPAMQITSITRSNTAYTFNGLYNVNRGYSTNGLNQHTSSGGVSLGYDARGNLTNSGSSSYGYNRLNQMISAPSVSMYYDSVGRLQEFDAISSTRYYYSGSTLVAEVSNPSNTVLRRYVPGPGTDEIVVWYQGTDASDRRFLQADERGSVIAVSDSSGNVIGLNRYDEYGIPASTNIGRFQYTGQTWYPELGMYSYKARVYSPTLGRFMQTDPIGYADGLNWYGYVKNDPVNATDPTGTDDCLEACKAGGGSPGDIYVPGRRSNFWFNYGLVFGGTHGPDFGTIAQLTIAMQVDQAVLAVAGIDAAATPLPQKGWRESLCNAGNLLSDGANTAGDLSQKATVGGLVVTGAGVVTAQPEIVSGGVALMRLGGALGGISASLQITGGLAQGVSGHGWSNFAKGAFGAAVSAGVGGMLSPAIPSGYRSVSQRAADGRAAGMSLIGGSLFGGLTGAVPNMGAETVDCRN